MSYKAKGAPLSTTRKVSEIPLELDNLAERASQAACDMGHQASELASQYYREGRKAVRRSALETRHFIEDQPVRSALLAIGIGCLLAAFCIRR